VTEFASNCPEACPPEKAQDARGDVFRFVRNSPPTHADMRSWEDEGRKPGLGDSCQRCALSILIRAEDILEARKAVPLFRRWMVAKAVLGPEHGKLCQTGGHRWHHSLWVRKTHGDSLHELFSEVAS
jgi:hypothetical protein